MDEIRKTTIVNAYVVDQCGRNPKDRFNLVIEIDCETALTLAISSSVNFESLSEFQIELPHSPDRTCKTGLTKRSAVCCDWVNQIPLKDCKHCGFVPGKLMPPIIDALNRYIAQTDDA